MSAFLFDFDRHPCVFLMARSLVLVLALTLTLLSSGSFASPAPAIVKAAVKNAAFKSCDGQAPCLKVKEAVAVEVRMSQLMDGADVFNFTLSGPGV